MGYSPTNPIKRSGETEQNSTLPYRFDRLLGRGGIADVYLAMDLHLKCQVAIKQLRGFPARNSSLDLPIESIESSRQRADLVARFVREWQAMGQIDHPHVVRARAAGLDQGCPYLVMDYMSGGDLESHVNTAGRPSLRQACEWIRQACEGLAYAHQLGWVHRDLKPSNLLLDRHGSVKLADFGISYCDHPEGDRVTLPGVMMGTPEFVAPEQIEDFAKAGPAADIYSLGCTFFQILFDQPPYGRKQTLAETLAAHHTAELEFPWHLRTDGDKSRVAVEALIRWMLEKNPEDRPASAELVLTELEKVTNIEPTWKSKQSWKINGFPSSKAWLTLSSLALGIICTAVLFSIMLNANKSDAQADANEVASAPRENSSVSNSSEKTKRSHAESQPKMDRNEPNTPAAQASFPSAGEATPNETRPSSVSQSQPSGLEASPRSAENSNKLIDQSHQAESNRTASAPSLNKDLPPIKNDFRFGFELQNQNALDVSDPLRFSCSAEEACQVFVFLQNQSSGRLDITIPNPKLEVVRLFPNKPVIVPNPDAFYQLRSRAPSGAQELMAVAIAGNGDFEDASANNSVSHQDLFDVIKDLHEQAVLIEPNKRLESLEASIRNRFSARAIAVQKIRFTTHR